MSIPKKLFATFDKKGRLVEAFGEADIPEFIEEGATWKVSEFEFSRPVTITRPRTYTILGVEKKKKG